MLILVFQSKKCSKKNKKKTSCQLSRLPKIHVGGGALALPSNWQFSWGKKKRVFFGDAQFFRKRHKCAQKNPEVLLQGVFLQNDQTSPENAIDWQYVIGIIWMKGNKSIHIRSHIERTRKTGGIVWNRIQQEFENILCQIEEDVGSSTMANHECVIYAGSMTHLLRFSPSPKKLASRLAMLGVSTIAWHNKAAKRRMYNGPAYKWCFFPEGNVSLWRGDDFLWLASMQMTFAENVSTMMYGMPLSLSLNVALS